MNVANLLLVRATARQREMAVRAALGASSRAARPADGHRRPAALGPRRRRGATSSGNGSAARTSRASTSAPICRSIRRLLRLERVSVLARRPRSRPASPIGLWPAWRASRADARAALHDGGKSNSDGVDRQRLRRLLVIGQISGALALLIVAGLFVRTLSSAQRIDLGFDAEHLITVRLDPRQIGYDEDRTNEFYKELQRRVAAWPDVASVAVGFTTPMSYLLGGGAIYIEGQPLPAVQPAAGVVHQSRRPQLLRDDGHPDRARPRLHGRRRARHGADAEGGHRQRSDGGEVLARAGSDRQALSRLQPRRADARDRRRRARQQVRAGLRSAAAVFLSAARARPCRCARCTSARRAIRRRSRRASSARSRSSRPTCRSPICGR